MLDKLARLLVIWEERQVFSPDFVTRVRTDAGGSSWAVGSHSWSRSSVRVYAVRGPRTSFRQKVQWK